MKHLSEIQTPVKDVQSTVRCFDCKMSKFVRCSKFLKHLDDVVKYADVLSVLLTEGTIFPYRYYYQFLNLYFYYRTNLFFFIFFYYYNFYYYNIDLDMFKLIYQASAYFTHSSKQTCRVRHIAPELRFINDIT